MSLSHELHEATPYQLRSLVLDYLTHECYTRTARAFAKDSAVRHLDADGDEIIGNPREVDIPDLSEVVLEKAGLRAQVRDALLAGNITEATELLNTHFPQVLNGDSDSTPRTGPAIVYIAPTSVQPSHLNLNLRIQSFIESVRTVPLPHPRTYTPKSHNSKRSSQVLDDDDPHTLDQQTAQLKAAQKLYASVNCLVTPEKEQYLEELSRVAGLLAYKVPETSSVAKYLSYERRVAVAAQINSAILFRSGLPVISKVELAVRYTTTLWGFGHDLRVPTLPGALVPPKSDKVAPTPSLKGSNASNKDDNSTPTFNFAHFMGTEV